MKTQHTPGPWIINWSMGDGDFHHIMQANQKDFGRVAKVDAFAPTDDDMELQGKANAALIAAAPDLLAGCRCALADLEGSYSREDWDDDENPVALTIRELIAAIAKAGGGK